MHKILYILIAVVLVGCNNKASKKGDAKQKDKKFPITEIASFKGAQVTGVSVSSKGRIFANFPRWRRDVKNAVVEVNSLNESKAYPNEQWNSWSYGKLLGDSIFVAIQSVVAFENELFVLDTRNPFFQGVQGNPRIFVFDLESDTLNQTYILPTSSFHKDSYINDLRIDKKHGKAYLTDSGHAGLLVLDLKTGTTKRVLDNHVSTLAEMNHLTINQKQWKNTVHSDGIALDTKNDILYYHSLTGYNLYAIPTDILVNGSEQEIKKNVQYVMKTPAPDGMIFDSKGNLYLADLENHKIMVLRTNGKLEVVVEGDKIKWADTFSIYRNELFFTNSRIHEAKEDIQDLVFTINKIPLD